MNHDQLELAVFNRDLKAIEKARHQKLDVNRLSSTGNSLIHILLRNCTHIEVTLKALDELLKFPNVDIDICNKPLNMSPLMYSIEHTEVTQYLVKKGANINLMDKFGNTALIMLTSKGYEKKAQEFLKHAPDVNTENLKGETALFYAIKNNLTELSQNLIEKGAKVFYQTQKGATIIDALGVNNDLVHLVCTNIEKSQMPAFKAMVDKTVQEYDPKNSLNLKKLKSVQCIVNSYFLYNQLKNMPMSKAVTTHKI